MESQIKKWLRNIFYHPVVTRLRRAMPIWLLFKVKPKSKIHGFDRGTPIDRKFIDKYVSDQIKVINNLNTKIKNAAEFGDTKYLSKYYSSIQIDKLYPPRETFKNDYLYKVDNTFKITNLMSAKKTHYDTNYDLIIATQVLNFVPNPFSAFKKLISMLSNSGILLITVAANHPVSKYDSDRWGDYFRFQIDGIRAMLSTVKGIKIIDLSSFGNLNLIIASNLGLAFEELPKRTYRNMDGNYPLVICCLVQKS